MTPEMEYRRTIFNVLAASGIQATPKEKAQLLMFCAVIVLRDNKVDFNGPKMARDAIAHYEKIRVQIEAAKADDRIKPGSDADGVHSLPGEVINVTG